MYLSRTNDVLSIFQYLLLSIGWIVGGWLLVTHAFHLRRIERLVCGLVAGLLLFISLSNLYSHFLPLTIAFWSGSLTILLGGVMCAWRSMIRPWLKITDFLVIPLIASIVVITILFTLILRGESIFDEYLHLPLISIMAAGDIPPHFYLNPTFYFAYHYGIQVFAASLVRLADFFPWSAWDISRALAIAITLALGWLWVRRITRSRVAAWLGSFLFTFGGGSRWLLLLLPSPWLRWVSNSVNLVGSGLDTAPTLAEALHKPWLIEGAGPVAFPFAFHSGIFVPVFFTLGSSGALPFMTILLLLLLLKPGRFSAAGMIIWIILFSSLALSAEHLFAMIWVGITLTILLFLIFHKRWMKHLPKDIVIQWAIILGVTAILALVQGGFITETARKVINSLSGITSHSSNLYGFSLRWPPGLLSAHLGILSVNNPGQLVALLTELGPALLLIPLVFSRFKKWVTRKAWFLSALAVSVILSLIFPLFIQYGVDRSTTRMPATALWTSMVLSFPILWMIFLKAKKLARVSIALGYGITILAGIVIFRTQLYSIPTIEYTYYIDDLDAAYSADYWDKLRIGAQVLDNIASRSVTLFGRISRANSDIYVPLPDWEALIANPEPNRIADSGYNYVYMDQTWWNSLTKDEQINFMQPCVDILDERKQTNYQATKYRLLINVSGCR